MSLHVFDPLPNGDAVNSIYDLLRQRCGLTQAEAADFHGTRIDTVKSWCSGRRAAPSGVIDELRDLYTDIIEAGEELAAMIKLRPRVENGQQYYLVGAPLSQADAVKCGFPSEGSCQAAVARAIALLPHPAKIVPRVLGDIPTAVSQKKARDERVTVYHFKVWDTSSDQYIVPERKSPLERIKFVGGLVLEETAERVAQKDLDPHGRYSVREVKNTAPMSARAKEIAKLHGLENWTSAKLSGLGIDPVPRIAFTFSNGSEVHYDAGICRRLFLELTAAGEHDAAKSFGAVIELIGAKPTLPER